jgi:hypothetical protein
MPSPDEAKVSKPDREAVDPGKPFPDPVVKPYGTKEDAKPGERALDPGKPFPDPIVKP